VLDGLARRFGDRVALDGVSFSVAPGQLFGFVGPNGAGKTTAMRIVLGVLEPDRGEVRWGGAPVGLTVRAARWWRARSRTRCWTPPAPPAA
jgi:ABC-2 type transport system ATP-binding protein